MKRILLLCILSPLFNYAQNVGVGTPTPDSSAALDITSANKGVLVPRVALLDTTQARPVSRPAKALLVYNTTINAGLSEGFYYWSGSGWRKIASSVGDAVPTGGIIEMETKTTVAGYTYIGYELSNYYTKIGQGIGAWNPIANNTSGNNVTNATYTLYNNKIYVWSGMDQTYASYEQDGRVYDIATDTWSAMSNTNAPAGRFGNVTATDPVNGYMIVWGGITGYTGGGTTPIVTNTGGIYDIYVNNTWYVMPNGPLTARMQHTGVWANDKMIVWGGQNGAGGAFADGAYYQLSTNSWTSLPACPLVARYGHSAVWTGTKMIIYGGTDGTTIFNDGAAYDPATNTWALIAANTFFVPSYSHTAVWTGTEMITFGGINTYGPTSACFRYNPSSNTWVAAATAPGASASSLGVSNHTAVWTGTEMVIVGGTNSFVPFTGVNVVRAYNPATDTWRLYNNLPAGKIGAVVVWTGTNLIVQGGSNNDVSGYKFNPSGGSPQDIEVSQGEVFYKYRKN